VGIDFQSEVEWRKKLLIGHNLPSSSTRRGQ
jgi:hypothetical protein